MKTTKPVPTSWPVYLLGAGVFLTLIFALLMPDLSDDLGTGARFAFWAAHIFSAYWNGCRRPVGRG